jgi:sec-independent protein translocase protein TatA
MVNAPVILFISGAPGSLEIIVVFVVILVLFGPQRLPAIARTIGRVLNQLRSASQDFKDQVMRIEDEAVIDLGEEADVSLSESLNAERDEASLSPSPDADDDTDDAAEVPPVAPKAPDTPGVP